MLAFGMDAPIRNSSRSTEVKTLVLKFHGKETNSISSSSLKCFKSLILKTYKLFFINGTYNFLYPVMSQIYSQQLIIFSRVKYLQIKLLTSTYCVILLLTRAVNSAIFTQYKLDLYQEEEEKKKIYLQLHSLPPE